MENLVTWLGRCWVHSARSSDMGHLHAVISVWGDSRLRDWQLYDHMTIAERPVAEQIQN